MSELIDVQADALAPGECIAIGGALVLVTAVERHGSVIDVHTEHGPALRLACTDCIAVLVAEVADDAA